MMEKAQTAKVEIGQQEAELTQLETETSRDAVKPEGDRTAVKTEEEPTRWIVCGDVVKLEKQEDLVQQGKLETEKHNQTRRLRTLVFSTCTWPTRFGLIYPNTKWIELSADNRFIPSQVGRKPAGDNYTHNSLHTIVICH